MVLKRIKKALHETSNAEAQLKIINSGRSKKGQGRTRREEAEPSEA